VYPLYVTEQGARLAISKRRLVVSHDGETLASVPLIHVSEVVLMGNVGLTTPAIKTLLAKAIDVVFLNLDGRYRGRLVGPVSAHVALRQNQYRRMEDETFSLALARQLVAAKLAHMRVLLQRQRRAGPVQTAAAGANLARAITALDGVQERLSRANSRNSLNGVEGAASAAYFQAFRQLFGPEWRFEKRLRRPPPDPVNVLLSYGYTLLTHAAVSAVSATGLDPFAGFLHTVDYNRPSLGLDLVEEFRPLVDSVILWACHGGQITPNDFTPGRAAQRPLEMSDRARKRFLAAYERRLTDELTHPILNQKLSLRRCLLAQARQLAGAVQSGQPDYVPLGFR
jgi:CRISPR-associated protein Cas1